jgi:signal transduction histidine kinase
VADPADHSASTDSSNDFDEFVAFVRHAMHDFNNVLTSMMGWAELGQSLELDERGARYLKDIFEAGKRGQELVHAVQKRLLEMNGASDASSGPVTGHPALDGGQAAERR